MTDAEGHSYEVYWETLQGEHDFHPANRFRYLKVEEFLRSSVGAGQSVIDVGCGSGELLRKIALVRPDLQLFGTDVSRLAVDIARSKATPATLRVDDLTSNFDTTLAEQFDAVILSEVIEHVPDDVGLLAACRQLLRPGGKLYLSTQSGPRFRMDVLVLGHLRHYDLSELTQMVVAAGFKPISSRSLGFPVLTLQKRVVELFFDRVADSLASQSEPGKLQRLIMEGMYWGMRLTPIPRGPQLVVIAERTK